MISHADARWCTRPSGQQSPGEADGRLFVSKGACAMGGPAIKPAPSPGHELPAKQIARPADRVPAKHIAVSVHCGQQDVLLVSKISKAPAHPDGIASGKRPGS